MSHDPDGGAGLSSRSPAPPIELHTPRGDVLQLEQRDVPGACLGCRAAGPGYSFTRGTIDLIDIQLEYGPTRGAGATLTLCGGCVAEGLAILLGRRHVQAGGSIEGLSFDEVIAAAEDRAEAAREKARQAARSARTVKAESMADACCQAGAEAAPGPCPDHG